MAKKKSVDKVFSELSHHHAAMADHHAGLGKSFAAMHEESGKPIHKACADDHNGLAKWHEAASGSCADGAEAMKSLNDVLSKTIVPDSISSVPPTNVPPEGFRFGITAIPRPGAPPVSGLEKADIDRIPHAFRHLVEIAEA